MNLDKKREDLLKRQADERERLDRELKDFDLLTQAIELPTFTDLENIYVHPFKEETHVSFQRGLSVRFEDYTIAEGVAILSAFAPFMEEAVTIRNGCVSVKPLDIQDKKYTENGTLEFPSLVCYETEHYGSHVNTKLKTWCKLPSGRWFKVEVKVKPVQVLTPRAYAERDWRDRPTGKKIVNIPSESDGGYHHKIKWSASYSDSMLYHVSYFWRTWGEFLTWAAEKGGK